MTGLQDGSSDVVVLEQRAAVGLRREDRCVVVHVDDVHLDARLVDAPLGAGVLTAHLQPIERRPFSVERPRRQHLHGHTTLPTIDKA